MPAGLTPTSVDGSGWNCAISGQLVHCTRSDVVNAASSYPTIALTAKVAEDAPATLTNTASVSGGGGVSAGVGSVTVRILRADLRITKTHQGSFKRGQTGALYSIAVTNPGDAATVGLVTVTDTLPAGLIAQSISGGGWSCTLSNLVCTRSDALAPGGAYPAISLIVDVGATAPASVTNTASVAGGADADPSNNTAADVTAIAPSDLTVFISGPSSLLQGQHGAAYTIDVSNIGNAPTSEPSTATVVLPGGLILDSATGAGWDCSLNGQTATCTRTDLLAAGDAFPRITLGISVPATATESGAITATVSGGGDGNLANNMSSVKFSITASPDLTITLAHTGTFAQGNVANYQITVRNIGAAKTNAVVTVTSQLPADLKPSSASGKGWTCSIDGQTATCIRADELSANSSYPAITLDANISSTAPAVIVTTAQVSGGGDVRTDNNTASDTASITQLNPDLKITMMHTGDFLRGQQQATFSMLVSNVGNGAARGAVTLANEVPAGLTPTGASGAGWDCRVAGQTITCSRSDAVAAGDQYPSVTAVVSVASNAPDALTNQATVAGEGDPILTNNTATDAVNIISMTAVDLSVTKTVDRVLLSPGDNARFTLGLTNPNRFALSEVRLRDTLPPGFIYLQGTATMRLIGESSAVSQSAGPDSKMPPVSTPAPAVEPKWSPLAVRASINPAVSTPARAVEPKVENGQLDFAIGTLEPGALVEVSYKTVVSSKAHPGEFQTQVIGSAQSPLGQRVSTIPVQVRVVVTVSAFTLTQVMIGRVFEDANGNGFYDRGERGIPNVRVVTASGQSATTDAQGQYNLPSLASGSTMVAIDPLTIPPGYALPRGQSRLSGGSRLLRTPLDGGALLHQNFALVRTAVEAAKPAEDTARATPNHKDVNPQHDAAKLEIVTERLAMSAGGRDKQLIRIRALDDAGNPAMKTSVVVSTTSGMVVPVPKAKGSCDAVLSSEARPELSRQFTLETDAGEVSVCLISDVVPGLTHFVAGSTADDKLKTSTDVRFETEGRTPLLVAMGEIGVGLSDPKDGAETPKRVDGQATVFYQNSIAKNDLVTLAVRTKEGVNNATGTQGMFDLDPTQRIYPLMGDASTRLELAQSTGRVYARYDRGHSYAMFGDLRGDTASGRSGILDFSRNVNGARFQFEGRDTKDWIQGQVAQPKTAFMREVFNAEIGSAIHLARTQIVRASETIILEVRDRRSPETVLSRETLVRNVDYSLDVRSGVLYLTRMISLFDRELNLIEIICTYEYQTSGLNSMVYLGRGSKSFENLGLRLGASFLNQREGETDFRVGGAEVEQKLFRKGTFKAEVPVSSGELPLGVDYSLGTSTGQCCQPARTHNGAAVRAELSQPLGAGDTVLHGRFAGTDQGFLNPYGLTTVPGQRSGGFSVDTRPSRSTQLSLGFDAERNHNDFVDNRRNTFTAKLVKRIGESLAAKAGFDSRQFEDFKSIRRIDSNLIGAGLEWKPVPRLEASLRREQNLGEADPTYPSQTLLGGQFRMTGANRLFVTQRFSSSPIVPISGVDLVGFSSPLSTRETAIGVESRIAQHTSLTTRYRLDSGTNGTDSFAVFGVLTRVPITENLSADWSLNDAMHLIGNANGYVGGALGLSYLEDDRFRSSFRYELRHRDVIERMLSAGATGRLNPSVSVLGRYRIADIGNGVRGTDGQLAMALRPRESDRIAALFSYEHGLTNATPLLPNVQNDRRTDRLSADGLWQLTRTTDFYMRIGAALIPDSNGGRRSAALMQARIQQALTRRFDVALESRAIRESLAEPFRSVTAGEAGIWLSRDFRVGLGYSNRGYSNPGSLLNATASRGGYYMVLSSRLSAIFDLMGSGAAKGN